VSIYDDRYEMFERRWSAMLLDDTQNVIQGVLGWSTMTSRFGSLVMKLRSLE
jgi:hypothetical protein